MELLKRIAKREAGPARPAPRLLPGGSAEATEHCLWKTGDFVFCSACGAHTSERGVHLREDCTGKPRNPTARDRCNRLKKGLHPTSRAWLGLPAKVQGGRGGPEVAGGLGEGGAGARS